MIPTPQVHNIILAEDDPDDALFFELAIQEMNVAVKIRQAGNGDELMNLLKEGVPDLLFLDIHMPCKNGIVCLQQIRDNKRYDNVPIIMLTSSDFFADVQSSYNLGANFFITKTVSINELVLKLKNIFLIDWAKQMALPPLPEFVL